MANNKTPKIETKIGKEIRELSRQKVELQGEVEKFRKVTYEELASLDGNVANGVEMTDLPEDIQMKLGHIRVYLDQIDEGFNSRQRDRAVYRALVRACRVGVKKGKQIDHLVTGGRRHLEAPNADRFDQQKFDWLVQTLGITFSTDVKKFNAADVDSDDFLDEYPEDDTPIPEKKVRGPRGNSKEKTKNNTNETTKEKETPDQFPENPPMTDKLFEQQLTDGLAQLRNAIDPKAWHMITPEDRETIINGVEKALREQKEEIKASGVFPPMLTMTQTAIEQSNFQPAKKEALILALNKTILQKEVEELDHELGQKEAIDDLGFSLATIISHMDNPQEIIAELEHPKANETDAEKTARMAANKEIARAKLKEVISGEFRTWVAKNTQYLNSLNDQKRIKGVNKYLKKINASKHASSLDAAYSFKNKYLSISKLVSGKAFEGSGSFVPLESSPILSMALRGKEEEIYKGLFESFTKKKATSTDLDRSFSVQTYINHIEGSVDRMLKDDQTVENMIKNYRRLEDDVSKLGGDTEQYKKDLEKIIQKMKTVPKAYKDSQWEQSYKEYVHNHGKNAQSFNMWLETKSGIGMWEKLKYMFSGLMDMVNFWDKDDLSDAERDGDLLTELKDKLKNAGTAGAKLSEAIDDELGFDPETAEVAEEKKEIMAKLVALDADPIAKARLGENFANVKMTDRNGFDLKKETMSTWDIADLRFAANILVQNQAQVLDKAASGTKEKTAGAIDYYVMTADVTAPLAKKILEKKSLISVQEDAGVNYLRWHTDATTVDPDIARVKFDETSIMDLNDSNAGKLRAKLGIVETSSTTTENNTETTNTETTQTPPLNEENLTLVTENGETILKPKEKIESVKDVEKLSQNDKKDLRKVLVNKNYSNEVDVYNRPELNSTLGSAGLAGGIGVATWGTAALLSKPAMIASRLPTWTPSAAKLGIGVAAFVAGVEAWQYLFGNSPVRLHSGIEGSSLNGKTFADIMKHLESGAKMNAEEKEFTLLLLDSNVQRFIHQMKKPGVAEQIGDSYTQSGRMTLDLLRNVKKLNKSVQIEANTKDEYGKYITSNKDISRWSLNKMGSIGALWNNDPVCGDLKISIDTGGKKWVDFDTFEQLNKILANPSSYYE